MASNQLETFVNNVQSLSQQGNYSQLVSLVTKDVEFLSKNLNLLDNALSTFNIQEHSIGVLAILLAKFSSPNLTTTSSPPPPPAAAVGAAGASAASAAQQPPPQTQQQQQTSTATTITTETSNTVSHQLGTSTIASTSSCSSSSTPPTQAAGTTSTASHIATNITTTATAADEFEMLFTLTTDFVQNSNGEQIRNAMDLFCELCHKLTSTLIEKNMAIRGIIIIKKAIIKIQLNFSQLTPLHSDLCLLCLISTCLKPALSILNIDISSIYKKGNCMDVKYLLLYYYYGGCVYAGLKIFDKAAFFFEIALSTPSFLVSHIMLESYKKFILTSLIHYGREISLPKYVSHVVIKYIKPLCQPYLFLSSVFSSQGHDLNLVINKHQDVFIQDGNMGLVKQCGKARYKKAIQSLTKTFLTLSFSDMANRVKLPSASEAEAYILEMIEKKEIFATINQKDGMVSFHDNPEKYNDSLMQATIDSQIQKCISLEKKLKEMNKEITLDPQYIQKVSGFYEEDGVGVSGLKMALM